MILRTNRPFAFQETIPMKLYSAAPIAPNPRRVMIFLAEKSVDVPTEIVDICKKAMAHVPSERFANAF